MTNTLAYHTPVMANECIEAMLIQPDGHYIDATFGGGGHTRLIIDCLKNGLLLGFDQDEDTLENCPDSSLFKHCLSNYRYVKQYAKYHKIVPVDAILADLGISSHQIDIGSRGFSYRFDSELDMRMDQKHAFDAQHVLNTYSIDALKYIFKTYGELNQASQIAETICSFRQTQAITTTTILREALQNLLPKKGDFAWLSKVYQAIRMEVNQELKNLSLFLKSGSDILKPGGRFVILTYHSLEDRLVKNFFQYGNDEGIPQQDAFGNLIRPLKPINKKPILPSSAELAENTRSRSAKLRIAEKI